MAIDISIMFLPEWKDLEPYLKVDVYDKDGGHKDPRIRIGFDDMPEPLGQRMAFLVMPCVTCRRPNHPLRRRVGDTWERLYYAPACPLTVRMACSRSRAPELEYERFKGLIGRPGQVIQLELL